MKILQELRNRAKSKDGTIVLPEANMDERVKSSAIQILNEDLNRSGFNTMYLKEIKGLAVDSTTLRKPVRMPGIRDSCQPKPSWTTMNAATAWAIPPLIL